MPRYTSARKSILKVFIPKWRAHTRGINVRSNIFTRLSMHFIGQRKRLPLSRQRRAIDRDTSVFEEFRHFLPCHPLDASRDRNRHAGIPPSMRTYVGVFTNVISVIMGHPVSVQQCAGRPIASLLEMISVVLPCFSLDFAVTKADVT